MTKTWTYTLGNSRWDMVTTAVMIVSFQKVCRTHTVSSHPRAESRATGLGCRYLSNTMSGGRSQVFNLSGVIIKVIHTTWFLRLSCWSHQRPSVNDSGWSCHMGPNVNGFKNLLHLSFKPSRSSIKMGHSDQTQCEYSLCILSEHTVSSCSVSSCSGVVNVLDFHRSAQVIEF